MKRDVLANYLCTIWVAVLGLAFIPVYVRILGIETYGLIGFFAALQIWLNLLDAGLSPALNREMSRFLGNASTDKNIRDLLRSIEYLLLALVSVIVLLGSLASGWLALTWFNTNTIAPDTLQRSIFIAFWVIGLSLAETMYRSAMIGLQRHATLAKITASLATVRNVGAAAVLLCVSRTPEAFFLWQAAVTCVSVVILNRCLHSTLPRSSIPGRFSIDALMGIKTYALGVIGVSALSTIMTQSDKLILSKHLPLDEWGHYSLAVVVAGAMGLLYQPIYQAWLPKMSEKAAMMDNDALARLLHTGTQLVAAIVGSAAMVLAYHAETFLHLWTQDMSIATSVAPILRLLVIGTFLNSLMAIPYGLQLAHGWTSLGLRSNAWAACIIVPLLMVIVPKYGAIGAASLWVLLNLGYVLVMIHFMFRTLLRTEKRHWYVRDVFYPLIGGACGLTLAAVAIPATSSALPAFFSLLLTSSLVLVSAGLASPDLRRMALGFYARFRARQDR